MRTRTLALLLVLLVATTAAWGATFRFTATADPRQYDAAFDLVLAAMQSKVGGIGVFHVSPGDIDPPQNIRSRIDTRFGTSAIWYPGIGNHEEETPADMTWLRDEYNVGNGGRTALKYSTNQDGPAGTVETTYSWDYGNAHFVMLNEYWDGGTAPGSDVATDGDIVPALLNWLAQDLAANTKPVVIVFGHEPAFPLNRHVGDSLDKYPANRDAFWNLLESDTNVKVFVVGHTHVYSKYQKPGGRVWQIDLGNAGNDTNGDGKTFLDVIVADSTVTFDIWRDGGTGSYTKTDSWSVPVTAVVSSPTNGSTVNTTTPTIQWSGPAHDAYQVRVTQVNDPDFVVNGWDSGQVSSSASSVVCGALDDFCLYYAYVCTHAGSEWTAWSPAGHNFAVNTNTGVATIYTANALPSAVGWVVYDTASYENSNGIESAIISDGGETVWRLYDNSTTNRCKEQYSVSGISFDTGATVEARLRCSGIGGSSSAQQNFGISKVGAGGMFVSVQLSQVALMTRQGAIRGSYALDGTVYHEYRLTVKNATPGDNATALWVVYVDGVSRISWTGAGLDNGFDGFMIGHGGAGATGYWYFDWLAGRSDGEFSPAAWRPVMNSDAIAPGVVTAFAAASNNGSIDLTWTNPTDADWTGTKILYKTTGYPTGPTDGSVLYDGMGASLAHNSLTNGVRYYYSAFAHDWIPNYSTAADVATTPALETTIQAAKELADGQIRSIKGSVVSAVFTDCFYIQDPAGYWGIKVTPTASVSPGQGADVVGTISGSGAERYIDGADNYVVIDSPGPGKAAALAMSNPTVGGASLNVLTPGVTDGIGPNNIGLYIMVWGKVTGVDATTFLLSDGSGSDVKVTAPAEDVPADDSYALVTGISVRGASGDRQVRAESPGGVLVLLAP